MRLSFIGGGTMPEAIIGGILEAQIAVPKEIWVGEVVKSRREYLSSTYGINAIDNNIEAINESELIVLSIKPQDVSSVSQVIQNRISNHQTVVSIIAGATINTLMESTGHSKIIRIMPNTPAQIGSGMSVWTASDDVDASHIELTKTILSTIGEEIYVYEEKYLDMSTGLSASGPAYVFLIIEALIDAGVYVGLPRDMARKLALQTVYGSAKLVMETGRHPGELKDMVVSPGGTTAEGVQVLEKYSVPAALVEAVNSAYLKSIRLGEK